MFAKLIPIFGVIFSAIHPLFQPSLDVFRGRADFIPGKVKIIVPIVITLGIGWVTGIRYMTNCADDIRRDHGPVRV